MHLSLSNKRWIEPEHTNSIDTVIEQLFHKRGIQRDTVSSLTNPDVFSDLQKACERIGSAIANKESICIFGDYDCDGVCSTAQLVRFFRRRGVEPMVRLPHRVHDGYGLNTMIIDELKEKQINVLITVDTGISSAKEIAYAQENGIDVIVTDHHAVPEASPNCCAILHPALAAQYPEPHPCGAGVVYQLLCALEGDQWEDMATDQVLAMIGTIADVVPLQGDNRTMVQQGLKALPQLINTPLAELFTAAEVSLADATSTDIAFRIAPRINAAGRMADPTLALHAVLEGGTAVQELCALNSDRQLETEEHIRDAEKELNIEINPPLLLASARAEYPHGIIGLIAGKLTEATGRPSMIATVDGDECTASLRSPAAYHIAEALGRHAHLLKRFGGHAQAAGCTLELDNWLQLVEALTEDMEQHVDTETLVPTYSIDAEIQLEDISLKLLGRLAELEPYGQGNREPLFLIRNANIQAPRGVGAAAKHLQCKVGDIKAIGFGLGDLIEYCYEPVDILCRLSIDSWQGWNQPQIRIVDITTPVSASV